MKSVEAQASDFIYVGYGKSAQSCTFLTECRVKVWRSKTSSNKEWGSISKTKKHIIISSSVKPCPLRSTSAKFIHNVHSFHLQSAIWRAALPRITTTNGPNQVGLCLGGWPPGCRASADSTTWHTVYASRYTTANPLQLQNIWMQDRFLQLLPTRMHNILFMWR